MTEDGGGLPELSPGTMELLEAWLATQANTRVVPTAPPDVAGLVQYLAGSVTPEQARAIERGLVEHAAARTMLRQVRAILDSLQGMSWQEIAGRSAGSGLDAEVARHWLELLDARAGATARAGECWLTHGWEAVRRDASAGVAEAQLAWTAFKDFCARLPEALQAPRPATVRGESDSKVVSVDGLPTGVEAVVHAAEVTDEGDLNVTVRLSGSRPLPGGLEGLAAHLALAANGEIWPLAAARVERDSVTWHVPEVGPLLGFPPGGLPAGCLALTFGAAPSQLHSGRVRLPTRVQDRAGREEAAPVHVELIGEPRWDAGKLILALGVPGALAALYPRHSLALELAVAADVRQLLDERPLSEWGDTPRTVAVPCPGSPEGALSLPSLLRVSLRPPE